MGTEWPGDERRKAKTDVLTVPNASDKPEASLQILNNPEPVEPTAPEPTRAAPLLTGTPLVTGTLSSAITGSDALETPLPAEEGWQRTIRTWTGGLISPKPGPQELARRATLASIRRVYPRPVTVTVAQPAGGSGKTSISVALASTLGNTADHAVLAMDNNETMGTLGVRTRSNGSNLTIIDLLDALEELKNEHTRSGDVQYFTRPQGDNRFAVLASDEDPDRMQMLTRETLNELLEVVQRFWNVIVLDTGNNTRAENWLAGIERSDQLVFPVEMNDKSVVSVLRTIEQLQAMSHLSGNDHYAALCRHAVLVISPGSHRRAVAPERRKELRTMLEQALGEEATFLPVPYEPALDTNGLIDWQLATDESVRAFEKVAAAVSEGMHQAAVRAESAKRNKKEN
ncbi:MinD/ParA family ATP-binding protein [Glutamicibacter sp. AOP12-B1-11]|uniref:MinD/ParA family ATP-binding protein n=1 Tax=Glutamicibacter sp. AOP12-B1-11 TaxID=3457725 RepID=UPI00403459F4